LVCLSFCIVSLFQAVASKDGNVFISPISVEVVLALAYTGAAGNTAEQIASALHLPADREDVKSGFLSLLGLLKVRNDSWREWNSSLDVCMCLSTTP
jgi:serpin B